jgi:hypothetical protein
MNWDERSDCTVTVLEKSVKYNQSTTRYDVFAVRALITYTVINMVLGGIFRKIFKSAPLKRDNDGN